MTHAFRAQRKAPLGNLDKGGRVPVPLKENLKVAAASESAPQQDRLETSFADGLGALGVRANQTLVALTHDRSLRETLTAVAPEHALSFVDTEAELTNLLLTQPAGVAILDSTAVGTRSRT